MKILGIIPARHASARFPGKPLIDIGGKTMIQRVYEQAKKSKLLSKVIVATDDQRIFEHVIGFGGLALMTKEKHQSGTDRCAEVLSLEKESWDVVINIQGDEPFIDPTQIDLLAECFGNEKVKIATLVKEITDTNTLQNPNIPKVVFNKDYQALYFSRAAIPFNRNVNEHEWLQFHKYYKHIGLYAYRATILDELALLPISMLEKAEALEQLRWLENGYAINVAITSLETIAIDTPSDLEAVKIKYL
jgi:3-deoxy-manno-octulosonate cytidylyltransferase (CMP-KDO synthetase)